MIPGNSKPGYYLSSTLHSLQVLIPSTFQSGQKPAKAVPRAIAAITIEVARSPVPIWTKMPAMRRTIPIMIRIVLSMPPTFFTMAFLLWRILIKKIISDYKQSIYTIHSQCSYREVYQNYGELQ
jgi:hypothetical protein